MIPASAHGTNPASAVQAGYEPLTCACDENGNVDLEDLRAKAEAHKDELAALMITYPSTHGIFEEEIKEICEIIHACGAQVYMDGANMNGQVGLTNPGTIGADVCHLNLHKTFASPPRWWRSGRRSDLCGRASGAFPSGTCQHGQSAE